VAARERWLNPDDLLTWEAEAGNGILKEQQDRQRIAISN
jgi:hypothetical protein